MIEYETQEALEMSRQRIASDPAIQTFLTAWRSLVAGFVRQVFPDEARRSDAIVEEAAMLSSAAWRERVA